MKMITILLLAAAAYAGNVAWAAEASSAPKFDGASATVQRASNTGEAQAKPGATTPHGALKAQPAPQRRAPPAIPDFDARAKDAPRVNCACVFVSSQA